MKRLALEFLVFLFAAAIHARAENDNPDCPVPHHPLRWHAAYCMTAAGTDDLETIQNTPCMADAAPKKAKTVCSQNAYWKEKWCNEVIRYYAGKTVADCVADRTLEPRGVAEGF